MAGILVPVRLHQPARYFIRVQGVVDSRWTDRLGGMRVLQKEDGVGPSTVLSGELADQAALLGVLNCLYNLGLPLLSVRYVGAPEDGRPSRQP